MNVVHLFITGIVICISYAINNFTVRCCYERRGYMDGLRKVNRLLYLLPTICTIISMVSFSVTIAVTSDDSQACTVHVFLLITPLCIWTIAVFVKTINIPPGIIGQRVQDITQIHTSRRPRRPNIGPKKPSSANTDADDIGSSNSRGTVTRHPFADPADENPAPQGKKHDVELATLGVNRISQDFEVDTSPYVESDIGSVGELHVESKEEVRGYNRAAGTLVLCLGIVFFYAIASGTIDSDPAFVIEGCIIGQLQVLHIISISILFTIISFATVLRSFSIAESSYIVRTCKRSSIICLVSSICTLAWFSQQSMFRHTGGEFLITMSIIIAILQQIVMGAPYIAGLSGSASAIVDRGRPQEVQEHQQIHIPHNNNTSKWPTPHRRDSSLIDVSEWTVPQMSRFPEASEIHTEEGLPELRPSLINPDTPSTYVSRFRELDKQRERNQIAEMLASGDDDDDDNGYIDRDDSDDFNLWFTTSKP